jgi:hypothetical protein
LAGSATVLNALFSGNKFIIYISHNKIYIYFLTLIAVLNGFASLPSPVSSLPVASELYNAPAMNFYLKF